MQADINIVLDTLLKADELIEWYRRQTGGTRALAVIHAMDAMKRLSHEAAGYRPLYDCPDCAFTFGAEHTDEDGGYSCPQCLEASLRDEIASWKRLVEMKDDALERIADPHSDRAPADLKDAIRIAQGARDGTQWPTAFPTAPALLAARELLAVPFGPDTRWESEARPILESLADDHELLLQSVQLKMARLRQAEEVLDGYECDLEDVENLAAALAGDAEPPETPTTKEEA